MKLARIVILLTAVSTPALAETTCYGEGEYQVCVTTQTDSRGNISITSSDTMGNSYSVESKSYTSPDGRTVIQSQDSMGNGYKVESWSDSGGVHSVDSLGNSCTITNSGTMIGCN